MVLVAIEKSIGHQVDVFHERTVANPERPDERCSVYTEGDLQREERQLAVFCFDIVEGYLGAHSSGLVSLLPYEEGGVKELLGREVDATAALEEARNQ